ncbi:MAG TPA: H4MPT-linked C1 transfer pathway protein [Methanoculleus sp.]|nr:H4MPT-linked C1 transfer pathway protein [Methanoculleus sp.]
MIGIDVGGANLKVVTGSGIHIHYCPLWQQSPITEVLSPYSGEAAAVVMSGELADGFSNKNEGIRFIVDAVRAAIPGAVFYGTDGRFHLGPDRSLAAGNWLASADWLREQAPDGILVDIGSTTTDIIPLEPFDTLKGLSDLDRLQRGMLVYTGILRAPVPSLLRSVSLAGTPTLVSSELFAISADVHLVLGHIRPDEYTVPTPDGAQASVPAALQRLSRVVCSDFEEIGEEGAYAVAEQFWQEQRLLISSQIERLDPRHEKEVIVAGVGAKVLAGALGGAVLADRIGEMADALPAYAVREVALRTAGP